MNTNARCRKPLSEAWQHAVHMIWKLPDHGGHAGRVMEAMPHLAGPAQRTAQAILLGVIRERSLLEWQLKKHLRRMPRRKMRALLLAGAWEIRQARLAQRPLGAIVDGCVEGAKRMASAQEAGLVNAVLRQIAVDEEEPASEALAMSHPAWLVDRWRRTFGTEETSRLLAWNQRPAETFARLRTSPGGQGPIVLEPPAPAAPWPGFVRVPPGALEARAWQDALAGGHLYIQDPATRLCAEALAPQAGEAILDLCAAPGGKTLLLADGYGGAKPARLVAVDLPGERMERLRANTRAGGDEAPAIDLVEADVLQLEPLQLQARGLPQAFAAVLLDAPCSNTGVLQRRPDVKWRLGSKDFEVMPALQLDLLRRAATFVAPGGRLVYSTCSIEPEENEGVPQAFLASPEGRGFRLLQQRTVRPWLAGHDGAGIAVFGT